MAVTDGAVLALRALGLGDFLTGVPALRALERAYPDRRLVLAAPEPLGALLPLVSPRWELLPTPEDRVLLGGLAGPDDIASTPDGREAATGRPYVAADLHGRGPESIDALAALRPGRLMCFAHPARTHIQGPDWRPDEHEVVRWCRMLAWHGVPADPDDLDLRTPGRPSPVPGAAIVHPGAAYPSRRWPVERYAEVARRLRDHGYRVVITGDAAERPAAVATGWAAGLPPEDVLAGRTTLPELAALVRGARLVISGDTGIAHLATAYRTPAVTLYGPVPPDRWGPPPDRPEHATLWAGRTGDPWSRTPDPGLLQITADQVMAAVRPEGART